MTKDNDAVSTAIEALQAQIHISMKVGDISEQHADLCSVLSELEVLESCAAVGGLLTVPEFLSNNLRIEVLQHLLISNAKGKNKFHMPLLERAFNELGAGSIGLLEDPAEDMLVGNIRSPRGNFKLLEGLWESASCHTQRFVTLIEEMPKGTGYDDLRNSVYALLKLSDEVCARSGLERNQLGASIPIDVIPHALDLSEMAGFVTFTTGDLSALGIVLEDIHHFIFDPHKRNEIESENIGHTSLERRPLLCGKGKLIVALPTAISAAIRRFVIERMERAKMLEGFAAAVAKNCAAEIGASNLVTLGAHQRVPFMRTTNAAIGGFSFGVDVGRWINLVLISDGLNTFNTTGGLSGSNVADEKLAGHYRSIVQDSHSRSGRDPSFVEGVTLIVFCGVGRGAEYDLPEISAEGWRTCHIGLADLHTLWWSSDFTPLLFFRILEAEELIASNGLILQNVNGLLNLIAWARSLSGHLVPHGDLPDDFYRDETPAFMMINQNSTLDLRHEVSQQWDAHVEQYIDGRWLKVRKEGVSLFKEDQEAPLYVTDGHDFARPLGVYVGSERTWWCDVKAKEGTPGSVIYERWKLSKTWLQRIAAEVDERFKGGDREGLLLDFHFDGELKRTGPEPAKVGFDDVLKDIRVTTHKGSKTIVLHIGDKFEGALFNPENIAERALVTKLLDGIWEHFGTTVSKEESVLILARLMPDATARMQHAFRASGYRDYVRGDIDNEVTTIDQYDDSILKIGLGWKARRREEGPIVEGKIECISFLNAVTKSAEDELCAQLSKFNRRYLIEAVVRNHEAAMASAERWRRTSAAVVSLHKSREDTFAAIAEHEFKLNGVLQASRVLVEMAVCEATNEGGRRPGELDLSKLMARSSLLHSMGGWSDAIRWGVMEPRLRITPLGDIHADLSYVDEIMRPYARASSDARYDHAVSTYADSFIEPQLHGSTDDSISPDFLAAWDDELGYSVDAVRAFVDTTENIGIARNESVFAMKRSELMTHIRNESGLAEEMALSVIDSLSLKSRPVWRDVPPGYDDRDRQPWRFRRRLALIRKPLVEFDANEDPLMLVAPAMIRDSLRYTVRNYYEGDFPQWQLGKKMRGWAGKQADLRGRDFAEKVGDYLAGRGWKVTTELKIKTIATHQLDRDYGDIDVLAFDEFSKRVLLMECKDLQFRKTHGEIAEQIADFRGEIRDNGKADYLLKHLNRVELISKNPNWLSKYLRTNSEIRIENYLVFSNPVPMEFSVSAIESGVVVCRFDSLDLAIDG